MEIGYERECLNLLLSKEVAAVVEVAAVEEAEVAEEEAEEGDAAARKETTKMITPDSRARTAEIEIVRTEMVVATATVVATTTTTTTTRKEGKTSRQLHLRCQRKKEKGSRRNAKKPRQPKPSAGAWRKRRRLWRLR